MSSLRTFSVIRFAFALCAAALFPSAWAQKPGDGIITGRVSNAATRALLEGASLQVDGAEAFAVTDREGRFRLHVPAGRHTIRVSYTGLDAVTREVAVGSGATVALDVALTAGIYLMDAVNVSSEREGNALAVTLQRQAMNVKNVVSADAFGTLAGNPAELVARLPGVVGESVGGDIRYIRIRGISHTLNAITMDGNRMADAAGSTTNREFQFQQIGSDSIERIEVIKSPTPDMDADSIGGAVNMVSKSAFDRSPERRIGLSAGGISHLTDERDRLHPNLSLSFSEVFKGKLGVAFNFAYRAHNNLYDSSTQNHQNSEGDPAYTYDITLTDNRNVRTRWGGGIKLDYKVSEAMRVYLNSTVNLHTEEASIDSARFNTAQTIATRDAAGNLTGTGAIIPGFTSKITEWRPVANSIATITGRSHRNRGDARQHRIGAVHRYEDLEIDYDGYRSTSVHKYYLGAIFNIVARGVGMRIDRTGDTYFPDVRQTAGPDLASIASYTDNTLQNQDRGGEDAYTGASLNVKKTFATTMPFWMKAGLRWREQTRDLWNAQSTYTFVGPDGRAGTADDNLARFVNPSHDQSIRGGKYPRWPYPTRPYVDEKGFPFDDYGGFNVGTALRQNPGWFTENVAANTQNPLTGNQRFKETIGGGYVMGYLRLGRLGVQGGVRVEDTKTKGEGALQQVTAAERARRAAWVGAVTPEEQRRRTTAEFSGRRTASGDYREVFPGLHLKYEPRRGLVLRASWATNIGRPGIGQLIPNTTINDDARSISTSNPSLLPQFSDNYDLSAEYHFEPIGLFSVGLFRKEIKNFIYTAGGQIVPNGPGNGFDGQFEGYTLTSQANGGFAKVQGIELSYQQQFTFLPGWFKGFGVFANYTRLETEGDYGEGAVRSTAEVAGFTPESANAGISYIRHPLSIRVQVNHVGRWLNTFNASRARLLYRTALTKVDLKMVYTLSRRWDLYLDVTNVLDEPDRRLEWFAGRPQLIQVHSPMFYFGTNVRL
ncbi:MAG: TonB-dependent receptor [Opitutaceae bacterium]|nr:TonB-dependent receptor [Opitutaceae bacterium]